VPIADLLPIGPERGPGGGRKKPSSADREGWRGYVVTPIQNQEDLTLRGKMVVLAASIVTKTGKGNFGCVEK
jgi:hypothetical protein